MLGTKLSVVPCSSWFSNVRETNHQDGRPRERALVSRHRREHDVVLRLRWITAGPVSMVQRHSGGSVSQLVVCYGFTRPKLVPCSNFKYIWAVQIGSG